MQIELDKVPELIKDGKMTLEKAAMEVFTVVYTNPGRFNLLTMDEDERSDFLLELYPKLQEYVKKYDSAQCPFGAYIFNILNWLKSTWTYKKNIQENHPITFDQSIKDFYPVISNAETDIKDIQFRENLLVKNEVEGNTNLIFKRIFESPQKGKYVLKSRENTNSRRIALLLALKSAWYIDDQQIEKVSIFCGLPSSVISVSVEKLKAGLNGKAESHEKLTELRDRAWYFICIYRSLLKFTEPESPEHKDLMRKLNYQEHVWKVKNELLKNCKARISPSNTQVAEIVGIKPSRVSFYMGLAKKSNLNPEEFL